MTFGPNHYVPVLKVKRGEKAALLSLEDWVCAGMTPLLEVVERVHDKSPDIQGHLEKAFKGLAGSVARFSRVFLDAREIAPDGPTAAHRLFQMAQDQGILFTPVTGVGRSADVAAALEYRALRGLCLRVTRDEFETGVVGSAIGRFLGQHAIAPEEIDLILDMGPVEDLVSFGVANLAQAFLGEVPELARWKTLTLSGSAFPGSMAIVNQHSHHFAERSDWLAWRDELYPCRTEMTCLPAFSDCCIQHPKGVEQFDARLMAASAVIRYTIEDAWLLVKGESTRRQRPSIQFPSLATQLSYGHLRGFFDGVEHCAGCQSIQASADGSSGLGSLEVWRRIGTIHHIAKVMHSLTRLTWP